MIKPSASRNYSITVGLFEPLVRGGAYIRTLENELSSYDHTVSAIGGFTSARIAINSPEIDDWIANGLGRHIVAYGSGGEVIWEGFVDNISINLGNITIERGRLTEICNRCSISYTPVLDDKETGDPVSGTTTSTLVADDQDSIDKYGIWEQIVSGGSIHGVGEDDVQDVIDKANYLRNLYLAENREPEVSHSPVIGVQGGDISITLDCKGYVEWLKYVYNFTVGTEEQLSIEVSDKIVAVIEDDPNDIFSSSTANINYNGMIINAIEDKDRTAMTVIEEAVSVGDINGNRWIFGIYEDRKPYYQAASTEIDYYYYVASNMQKVTDRNETEVLPWNVRPGKIAFLPDTILGNIPATDIRSDARAMFLEEVNFVAPDTINLTGKKVKTFDQLQAFLGLA